MDSTFHETRAHAWDSFYKKGYTPWQSSSQLSTPLRLIEKYGKGESLLEIGCGTGSDSVPLIKEGYTYHGIDFSKEAVAEATQLHGPHFESVDFFRWRPGHTYNIIYDKGFFHNLGGPRRRTAAIRRISQSLSAHGIWVTVCGAADDLVEGSPHNALFLRDIIYPAEPYFEILEVIRAPYGLSDKKHDFMAWHIVMRRRNGVRKGVVAADPVKVSDDTFNLAHKGQLSSFLEEKS